MKCPNMGQAEISLKISQAHGPSVAISAPKHGKNHPCGQLWIQHHGCAFTPLSDLILHFFSRGYNLLVLEWTGCFFPSMGMGENHASPPPFHIQALIWKLPSLLGLFKKALSGLLLSPCFRPTIHPNGKIAPSILFPRQKPLFLSSSLTSAGSFPPPLFMRKGLLLSQRIRPYASGMSVSFLPNGGRDP